jgi:hypothetical protein
VRAATLRGSCFAPHLILSLRLRVAFRGTCSAGATAFINHCLSASRAKKTTNTNMHSEVLFSQRGPSKVCVAVRRARSPPATAHGLCAARACHHVPC